MTNRSRAFGAAIGGALFFTTVAAFLRPPLLPDIGRDLTLSAIGLGALGSVFALGRLAADVPAGRLTDRIAAGPMMIVASSLVASGSLIFALAPNSTVAFLAALVLGAGSTWTLTTAQAYFADAPRARRGAAMSAFAGSLLVGQAIGPVIGGGVGSIADWRVAIGAGAIIALLAALPFLWLSSPRPLQGAHGGTQGEVAPIAPLVLGVIYLLPAVQFSIGAALVQTLAPIVADRDLGLGAGIVGAILGVGGIARLVAALAAGQVMDRVGRRAAMIPGLLLQFAGVGTFAFWPGQAALWLSVVLISLGSVGVNAGTAILADLSEGGRLGPRLGAFRFTGDAAFLVAPLLTGWLLEISGRTAASIPLLVLTALTLVGAVLIVPETHRVSVGTGGSREAT